MSRFFSILHKLLQLCKTLSAHFWQQVKSYLLLLSSYCLSIESFKNNCNNQTSAKKWRYSVMYEITISAHFMFVSIFLFRTDQTTHLEMHLKPIVNYFKIYFYLQTSSISRKHVLHGNNFSEAKIHFCKLVIALCTNSKRATITKKMSINSSLVVLP